MGRNWLSELTDASGGRTIAADNRRQIPEIAAVISREMRSQYVLGYLPPNTVHDGKWHKVAVKVTQPSQATPHGSLQGRLSRPDGITLRISAASRIPLSRQRTASFPKRFHFVSFHISHILRLRSA